MADNPVLIKSKSFAITIIQLYKRLCSHHTEYVLSKQLLRSGTSIGANIREGINGQSRADFIAKLSISLKEAHESLYWLELLHETYYITDADFDLIEKDCREIIALLTAILKTSRNH